MTSVLYFKYSNIYVSPLYNSSYCSYAQEALDNQYIFLDLYDLNNVLLAYIYMTYLIYYIWNLYIIYLSITLNCVIYIYHMLSYLHQGHFKSYVFYSINLLYMHKYSMILNIFTLRDVWRKSLFIWLALKAFSTILFLDEP